MRLRPGSGAEQNVEDPVTSVITDTLGAARRHNCTDGRRQKSY